MRGERCAENLKTHGFDAVLVPDGVSACTALRERIEGYETFGVGGSDTVRKIGILEELKSAGKTLYDHWETDTPEQDMELRLNQGRCDCFFTSANAISATGEIVNVDGIGNRTAAMSFGPKAVMIVAGVNKITDTLQDALERIRTVAGPMRAKSLGMKTPCAETGLCADCNSPQRICRVTTILHRKPMKAEKVSVILINKALGY